MARVGREGIPESCSSLELLPMMTQCGAPTFSCLCATKCWHVRDLMGSGIRMESGHWELGVKDGYESPMDQSPGNGCGGCMSPTRIHVRE